VIITHVTEYQSSKRKYFNNQEDKKQKLLFLCKVFYVFEDDSEEIRLYCDTWQAPKIRDLLI